MRRHRGRYGRRGRRASRAFVVPGAPCVPRVLLFRRAIGSGLSVEFVSSKTVRRRYSGQRLMPGTTP